MDTYELIKQAIRNKQQVVATYKDYYREMCPHALGTKNQKKQCLFYQFGGQSKSGGLPEWRYIPVDGLTDVSIQDGLWHTSDNPVLTHVSMSLMLKSYIERIISLSLNTYIL
jgi:hypothetical protein